MEVKVPIGKYVLAVSGGVDSMVLLDLLDKQPNIELVVAHFNHGIRPDAAKDEELVSGTANRLKLPFEAGYGYLGKRTSEEAARDARYKFLRDIKQKHRADAIITAHHQDDLIETALLNVLRGTGRRGLTAIADNKKILRPLMSTPKKQIIDYALKNKLEWHEDSTNQDMDYLRNYVRLKLLPMLGNREKQILIRNIEKVAKTNHSIDNKIATLSHVVYTHKKINRETFASLPVKVANELLAYWLRTEKAGEFDRKTVSRLNLAIKTAQPGSRHPIKDSNYLLITAKTASFAITPNNSDIRLV